MFSSKRASTLTQLEMFNDFHVGHVGAMKFDYMHFPLLIGKVATNDCSRCASGLDGELCI